MRFAFTLIKYRSLHISTLILYHLLRLYTLDDIHQIMTDSTAVWENLGVYHDIEEIKRIERENSGRDNLFSDVIRAWLEVDIII